MMRGDRDPDTLMTAVVGIAGAVLLVVVVLLLQAAFYRAERGETARKVSGVALDEVVQARSRQQELLNSYRWIDEGAGVVAIPIERAMALTVQRLGRASGVAGTGGGEASGAGGAE